ncbi:MAG: hypothetical protein U1E36_03585 [Rickettsiales bacterium]
MLENTHTQTKRIWLIIGIIALPIIGYLVMRMLPQSFETDGDDTTWHVIAYLMLIVVALGVPFLMLKSIFKSAHLNDRREPEVELKDIPKDKEQIARKS